MTPCVCTECGCEWPADGFTYTDGRLQQPCNVCRCDNSSIHYYQNAEAIREKRKNRYYADLAASREYERNRKRQKRSQAAAQMSVL